MNTIYIDVLLAVNFYVNYFLILGTSKITHLPLSVRRGILSALAGSLFSLLILLPPLMPILTLAIRCISAVVMVFIAFPFKSFRYFLSSVCCFFCISMLFAGFMLAMQTNTKSGFIFYSNNGLYLQISLLSLVLCTLVSYIFIKIFSFIKMKFHHSDMRFRIFIRVGVHTIAQDGLADTGNNLIDGFSGRPVIIFGSNALAELLGESPEQEVKKMRGYHLLPYSTVSGGGLLSVFRADEVIIQNETTGDRRRIDTLIGVGPEQDFAIFNPHILSS